MKLIKNETPITVTDKHGDFLFTGVFVGFGTISLGLNGQKQGIMVLSKVDDMGAKVTIHDLNSVEIILNPGE